jgi:hypothetical protein
MADNPLLTDIFVQVVSSCRLQVHQHAHNTTNIPATAQSPT